MTLIREEMVNICSIYHKKYITLLQSNIIQNRENDHKDVFTTNFERYCSFNLNTDNINSFLKLHKSICDYFIYLPQSNLTKNLRKDIISLNDDFNNKVSIYVLSINSKIIQTKYQYKRWPKNIFYSYLAKGKWIVWY